MAAILVFLGVCFHARAAEVDRGVIRLSTPAAETDPETGRDAAEGSPLGSGDRRGFDYQAFGGRFESLWFHRKAYLADGRADEAKKQADLIRSFVQEEGVRRLEAPAAALVWEANQSLREGGADRALAALHLAQALDPERAQIHLLRARVLWASGAGPVPAAAEALRGFRSSIRSLVADPSRLQPLVLVAFVAFLMIGVLYACVMAARYQLPLRHEVEEWMNAAGRAEWARPAGWAVLFLPLLTWIAAGWIFFYWIAILFRFMRRSEKTIAVILLLGVALSTPLYHGSIQLYGRTADPRIRTTFAAASGEYDPELIVRLQELVEADPDDVTYRFLLGGLYKDGRFFEEAFDQYRRVLSLNPSTWQAYVNIGNLYLQVGQYGEAIAQYRRALDIEPEAIIALMNTYFAQTESFRLNEAAATLEVARRLDGAAVATALSEARGGAGQSVRDATLDMRSFWRKVMEAGNGVHVPDASSLPPSQAGLLAKGATPMMAFAFLTLVAAVVCSLRWRRTARVCVRCGRPYCGRCKSSKEAPEYCSHCVHLFVFGDGLSPETRGRKVYEIERHERRTRWTARVASAIFPGTGEIWSGRTARGLAFCALWTTAFLMAFPSLTLPVERAFGVALHLSVIRNGSVPTIPHVEPAALIALPLMALAWTISNLPTWLRTREA